MPLFELIKPLPNVEIYIWFIEEEDAYFLNSMDWDAKQVKWLEGIHPVKRREYLASRFLIYQCTDKTDSHLYKDEAGKLFIRESNKFISVSHSAEWTGVAISEKPIGFDLQVYKEKIRDISNRFLSADEKQSILKLKLDNIWDLSLAWTIKEAVYKVHGQKGIQFSEQILMEFEAEPKPGLGHKARMITSEYQKDYELWHEKNEHYACAVAVEY
ncbi:MAG: 4'-phosphopantetheinyl transferase superfamily protein [Saprospiraceae bacterium]|nr:4'-phosphopantetheinyl transferase superfamily protein [Saprospiraceae bacterium]